MGIKSKRFILNSHEAENKDRRLRKILTVNVLLSAIAVPLLNDGALYTVWAYIQGDIALAALANVLSYLIVIIQYTAKYAAMAAMCVALINFGHRKSRGIVAIFLLSSLTTYMIAQYGSWLFQYYHGLLDDSDVLDVMEYAFNYSVFTSFDFCKSVVLTVLCVAASGKMRKNGGLFIADETSKPHCRTFKTFMKNALRKDSAYRKFTFFCMWIMVIYDILLTAYGKTLSMLAADGAPETIGDVLTLLSSYVMIIPGNILGFFVMSSACLLLSLQKSAPRPGDA